MVEDNPDHAELIRRTLESNRFDCRIDHAADGDTAIDYLFGDPDTPRPDLILLDIRLPRRSGMEVLRAIRESERFEAVPVVILTTSADHSDVETAYRLHANSYLVKPFEFQAFRRLLEDLGIYWLFWNQPSD